MPGREKDGTAGAYIPTLDGWRAVAVLTVMASHAQLLQLGPLNDSWFHDHGLLGVRVFFAISGILICGRLVDEESVHGSVSLRGFYLRRGFRILPVALLYLAVAGGLMASGTFHPLPGWRGWWASLLFCRNFLPMTHTGPAGWITRHFWSLSLEEQFYLLLPALLVLARRARATTLVAVIAALFLWASVGAPHLCHVQGPPAEFRPDLALNVLFIPALAAVLLRRQAWRGRIEWVVRPWPLFAAAIVLEQSPGLLVHHSTAWHGHLADQTLAVLTTALVLSTVLHPAAWLARLLESSVLRWIGRISYSLYLWQEIFLTQHVAPSEGFMADGHHGINWLLTFIVATASYYAVERPLVRLGHRFTRQRMPVRT